MNNELKIRLAEVLSLDCFITNEKVIVCKFHGKGLNKEKKCFEFTPETDYKLFHDCLVELYANGFQLLIAMDSRFYCYDPIYTSYTTPYFDTPEEAVYTAFCEMKENKND